MSVPSTTARQSYQTDGATTVFNVNIGAYSSADFKAILTNNSTGVATILALGTDYTLAAVGSLTPQQWQLTTQTGQFTSPYIAGSTLQIILNPVQTQPSVYAQGAAFPSLAVQQNLDRLTQMVQRLQDQINRTVIAPDGDVSPAMVLPSAALRGAGNGSLLAFNAGTGNVGLAVPLAGTLTQGQFNTFQAGSPPYIQTPAEIAAGVTPVSYQYVTNNVFRYLTAAQIADVIAGTLTLDCTAGIQNAINVAAAGFTRLVYFPGGYYLISSPLSLPLGMTAGQMYGEGKITTIKASAGFSGANMLTGAATLSGFELNDLTIDASGVAGITTVVNLARTPESSIQNNIHHIQIANVAAGKIGLNVDGCEDSELDFVEITGFTDNYGFTALSFHVPDGNLRLSNCVWFAPMKIAYQNGVMNNCTMGPVVQDGVGYSLTLTECYGYASTSGTIANFYCTSTNSFGSLKIIGGYYNPNLQNGVIAFQGLYKHRIDVIGAYFDEGSNTGYSLFSTLTQSSPGFTASVVVRGAPLLSGTVMGTPNTAGGTAINFVTFGDRSSTTINGQGWERTENGMIRQWGSLTLTGAANTLLTSANTNFPIAFPNGGTTIRAFVEGLANGNSQVTTYGTFVSTSQFTLSLVSSVTVTSAQTIFYEAWGY